MDDKQYPLSVLSVVSSTDTLLGRPECKRLHIHSKGIGLIRFPMPMSQNEIPIYDAEGSLAYVATKNKSWSSHSVLSSSQREPLVAIDYKLGGRPQLRPLTVASRPEMASIMLQTKCTSRAMTFRPQEGGCTLEWKYTRIPGPDGKAHMNLCLEKKEEKEGLLYNRQVAHLIRSRETRSPGSTRWATGQGGELILFPEEMTGVVDEALVVATCLVMLRAERDQRRLIQAMVIAGAGS
ncbi:hypothetical protein EYZ11_009622 [Aspergillus tanneri]|uniref:Uncharacterized protein n=1 Tax=Aspergillus tanneri TaxID=1220188 RepID=A0A4S3J7P1_9EURO|nr:uncharacterized protein ATNIH1004_009376 [Aspergillus tanneri]KAA8645159.1 hypothetical protein ATNIH1004_009376 [Aspergillus tanneri]THC90905.1 hypothetical protein EYZ11_009622 [Aspergillus tanneri]